MKFQLQDNLTAKQQGKHKIKSKMETTANPFMFFFHISILYLILLCLSFILGFLNFYYLLSCDFNDSFYSIISMLIAFQHFQISFHLYYVSFNVMFYNLCLLCNKGLVPSDFDKLIIR